MAIKNTLYLKSVDIKINLIRFFYRERSLINKKKKFSIVETISNLYHQHQKKPFQKKYLNPNQIKYRSGLSPPRLYGAKVGGEWDQDKVPKYCAYNPTRPIEKFIPVNEIRDYIEDGESEGLLSYFKEHIESDDSRPWGYTSIDDFEDRLKDIEKLYNSIKENGYLTQKEIMDREDLEVSNNEPVPPELNEVTVDIGRDGKLLYAGFGAHRLSIAKILDIEEIPVIVAARHKEA